jgi:hypothetical protein
MWDILGFVASTDAELALTLEELAVALQVPLEVNVRYRRGQP